LLFVVMGVLQVALLLHVRGVMTADAAEGARAEAGAGADRDSGGKRAHELVASSLSDAVAGAVSCGSSRDRPRGADPDLPGSVAVTCAGDVALFFLPGHVHVSATGHALLEGR
jgi:hypothetical protein